MLVRSALFVEKLTRDLDEKSAWFVAWATATFMLAEQIHSLLERERPDRHRLVRDRRAFQEAMTSLRELAPGAAVHFPAVHNALFPHTEAGKAARVEAERRLLLGDAKSVMTYVLDRVFRESAGLSGAESNVRISKIHEKLFGWSYASIDVTRPESAAIVQQLKRLRKSLANIGNAERVDDSGAAAKRPQGASKPGPRKRHLDWQMAAARWDTLLFLALNLEVPPDSLALPSPGAAPPH